MEKVKLAQEVQKKKILDEIMLVKKLGGAATMRLFLDEEGTTLTVNFGTTESYEKTIEDHKEAIRIFNYIHQKPSKKYLKTIGFVVN